MFVFSFSILSFFIAKGLVESTRKIVTTRKIKICHRNGSEVLAMKIIGRAAIAAQIVVNAIVNASISTNTIISVSQSHEKFERKKCVMP